MGSTSVRQRGPGRHGGWGRETHAHGAARVDELGVGGVAQRGFHRGVRGAKHEVRALREGRRQRRRRLVGGPRGWEVGRGIILAARVRLLRVPLAPHPPSVQRRPRHSRKPAHTPSGGDTSVCTGFGAARARRPRPRGGDAASHRRLDASPLHRTDEAGGRSEGRRGRADHVDDARALRAFVTRAPRSSATRPRRHLAASTPCISL